MTRIAVVVKGYPRLSETFIAQEILGLERRGLDVLIVSLRRPTDGAVHPVHREIRAEVLYLPEYLKDDPPRVAAGRRAAVCLPGYEDALAAYERDLARDRSASRRRRFGQACVLAAELPADIDSLYVHFLHTPASVTRYAAMMRGLPWSFSAHAKDIWTSPDWELAEKIADADWGTTCTAVNAAKLRSLSDRPEKVALVFTEERMEAIAASTPLRRGVAHDELARLATFLASDMARCITGQFFLADAGAFLSRNRPPNDEGLIRPIV